MQNNNNHIQGKLIEQVKNFFPEFKDNLDFDCLANNPQETLARV